jgi:NADH-quinone oxidoreductase subunit L
MSFAMIGMVLFPGIGFLINALGYGLFQSSSHQKKWSSALTGSIATGCMLVSCVLAWTFFFQFLGVPSQERVLEYVGFSWMSLEHLEVSWGFRLDSLSSLFVCVITFVGTLIHFYSIGYMKEDPTPGKFFAYLNLFCFFMLILVLGDSFPVMFLGWEGVGLCSYLLIGYWYQDEAKAQAGKKAFLVNRIGDFGFLLGIFFVFTTFGTLAFEPLKHAVLHSVGLEQSISWICAFLFVGCLGKSAQIPLYIWLPDAMAGPTPVSALIHAATMVTSGIYLVTRLHFLFSLAPFVLHTMAWIVACTAFFAASIALCQKDIKKVLAYSTVSQLGYMFLACGTQAFGAGVFHVITHAFFKALLFLGAGSVIHGMHEEQNLLKMGGLRKEMPHTFRMVALGWLAICGIPPFSGFFSKDEILDHAFHASFSLWALGAITAAMTAFYMTRFFCLAFLGPSRHPSVHVHESGWTMLIPLQVLGFCSVFAGFLGIPHANWLESWLEPIVGASMHEPDPMQWPLMGLSVLFALSGMLWSFSKYRHGDAQRPQAFPRLSDFLENQGYVQEGLHSLLVLPFQKASSFTWRVLDVQWIDGLVLGVSSMAMRFGFLLRFLQTGVVQHYLLMILMGLFMSTGYWMYVRG